MAVLFFPGLLTNTLAAKPVMHYGVFVYSNLCIEDQSGDAAGTRITLHHFVEGESVVYEYSDGALSLPVLAEEVKIDDRLKLLTFRISKSGQSPEFIVGELSSNGDVMTLKGDWCRKRNARISLRLVSDFSRPMKRCAPCPDF